LIKNQCIAPGKNVYSPVERNEEMNWIILIIAGFFEVGFATCLGKAKETSGTTSMLWLVGFFVSLTISMVLLYRAAQTLPIGTAYAVWTGIGAVGTVIVGILIFKEPADFWRLFFMTTLIASIVGLKFVSH
jgi:quaternary ammonium compound-resistance protein SugE